MIFLTEKNIEDVLVLHSHLIEDGLQFVDRQVQLETRRIDLLFKDRDGRFVCVELKKDEIKPENIHQISDYLLRFKRSGMDVRGIIIGEQVSADMASECEKQEISWRAISHGQIFEYLKEHDMALFQTLFIEQKVPIEQLSKIKRQNFNEYLELNSRYGIPLGSYQFLLAKDRSLKLSDDRHLNKEVADEFIHRILTLHVEREMFRGHLLLTRLKDVPIQNVVETGNGAWTGQVITFQLEIPKEKKKMRCQLYIGSIGMRGNPVATYADELSRFLVVRLTSKPITGSTQYGFHKHLCTEERALLSHHEIPFPNTIAAQEAHKIYNALEKYGYHVMDGSKARKQLWIGEIQLDSPIIEIQLGNLIETLFAVALVKEHFKNRNFHFPFLNE